jgi:hypothetical protein
MQRLKSVLRAATSLQLSLSCACLLGLFPLKPAAAQSSGDPVIPAPQCAGHPHQYECRYPTYTCLDTRSATRPDRHCSACTFLHLQRIASCGVNKRPRVTPPARGGSIA